MQDPTQQFTLLAKLSTSFLSSEMAFYKQDHGASVELPSSVEAATGQHAMAQVGWLYTSLHYFPFKMYS